MRSGQVTIGLDAYLAMAQRAAKEPSVIETTAAATFGDRIAVVYSRSSREWTTGAWDFECYSVLQLDANGLIASVTMFEGDDPHAALAEAPYGRASPRDLRL